MSNFLTDVYNSGINEEVTAVDDLEEAATKFQDMFVKILDKHAPVRVFQIKKSYVPYFSMDNFIQGFLYFL